MSLQLTACNQTNSPLVCTGSKQQTFSYSAYGIRSDRYNNYLGFNGERNDSISGVYHLGNGYRAYNPVIMRFTTPDNLSPFNQGGVNPYAYCQSDPINHTDPSGHIRLRNILFKKLITSIAPRTSTLLTNNAEEATATPACNAMNATSETTDLPANTFNNFKYSGTNTLKWQSEPIISGDHRQSLADGIGYLKKNGFPDFKAEPRDPGLVRRDELSSLISHHHLPDSIYIPAVACVNEKLQAAGIGLSLESFETLSNNIRAVSKGTRTEAAASLRESIAFSRDTFRFLRAGRFKDAAITGAGVLINITGSTLYFSNYDRERMSSLDRIIYDAMSPV